MCVPAVARVAPRVAMPVALAAPMRTYVAVGGSGPKNPKEGYTTAPPTRANKYLLDKEETRQRVMEVVKNFEKVDASKVKPDSHFINDLGLDSLDVVEIVMAFEQEFVMDIPDHDAERIHSIEEAADYIAQNPMAK